MKVVEKKPTPIYETVCPECKSRIEYKASEVGFTGHITCPVCGMSTWASVIKPVRYENGCEDEDGRSRRMRAICISTTNCQYKSDTGYCGYTGNGCAQGLVRSVKIDEPSYKIVKQVDISDESIEKIADTVIKKLLDYIVIPGGIEKW